MKVLRHLIQSSIILLSLLSLNCASTREQTVVATVGDNPITLAEYENLLAKTNGSKENAANTSQEEREKFLTLVANFRLKLLDAYSKGLDKSPEIQSEINLYKGSLASSFLTERQVTRPGLRKLFDDRRFEFRASHILLTFPQSASPADSAAVFAKAHEIISRIKAGEDFGALAGEFSQDPGSKQNKGDLYYFTAGQMVRPFEEAVSLMKPGEISAQPVQTQHGLHIIKLIDKKPSPGELRCSHIMARFSSPEPTPEDTASAYAKIKSIQDSLAAGADFAGLARRHSADPGSAQNGGDLGWFARRRWVYEFDDAAFKLQPGQTSGIVRSRYGYHVIKCVDSRPPKTFEESEKELQQVYQQTRFQDDYKKLVDRLKAETKYSFDTAVLSRFISELDSTKTLKDSGWADSLTTSLRKSVLVRFDQQAITVDSVVSILKQRPDLAGTTLKPGTFKSAIDKVVEQLVFAVKSEPMQREYPEFASLMKEYSDGILLYQIEQQKVWGSISVSDSALGAYFDAHRDKFMFPDRIEFVEIRAASDSTARTFQKQVKNGKRFEEIAAADSARMKRKNNYPVSFSAGSSTLSKDATSSLQAVAGELIADSQLRVHVIAHPDTASRKARNTALASKRVDLIRNYLTKKLGVPSNRIQTFTRPVAKSVTATSEREKLNSQIDVDIVGRRPAVTGKIETVFGSASIDERGLRADSLEVGEFSEPFRFKNGYSIVRLLRRETARPKTFEEAGTEVSSAFQEYESKRLENEWLQELKRVYPVIEHKERLRLAFAPGQ